MLDLNPDLASMAAQAVNVIAKQARGAGDEQTAQRLVRQAAEIELMSTDLQNCWGGPFNGQAGRLAIVEELLAVVRPQAIVETGTFRGISTHWFALNFRGPVWSCETEEINLIQAQSRLAGCADVELSLADSRSFLREAVARLDPAKPAFFYLDAHWKQDLPLTDELRIIFATLPDAVVMVDDFRIPDDPGYGWDDYGPGVRVDTTALSGALPAEACLYVPRLPSQDETGARRGCCVIAWRASADVDQCRLLLKRSISNLAPPADAVSGPQEIGEEASLAIIPDLEGMSPSELLSQIAALNKDRAQRLNDVKLLTEELGLLKADRVNLLRDTDTLTSEVHRLQAANTAIEADSAQRLRDVHTLTDLVNTLQPEIANLRQTLADRS